MKLRYLSMVLFAVVLLSGGRGLVAVRPADAEPEQEIITSPPDPVLRRARAARPSPEVPCEAMPSAQPLWMTSPVRAPLDAGSPDGVPDFAAIGDVRQKKERFFSYLLPLVEDENRRLLDLRRRLGYIRDHVRWGHPVDEEDLQWLCGAAKEFRVDRVAPATEEFWSNLLGRVDALPAELVLVQAANESAWGTSRFAREGNNYFGQWCFRQGCGMVPASRPEGATYEVARFPSTSASVSSYMRNLNTGRSYRELRKIRARLRADGQGVVAADLAVGLRPYSARGSAYIDEIQAMLRHNAAVITEARSRLTVAKVSS